MRPFGTWIRKPPNFLKIGSHSGCRSTGSKKRGLDYHRRVYRDLRDDHSCRLGSQGWTLLIEPWYWNRETRRYRQPDAVLVHQPTRTGIVIEVKLNWKDGRDIKLVNTYLPIVKQAEDLDVVWPLLITQCLRGWQGTPITRLEEIHRCQTWQKGEVTPLMLLL